LAYKYYVPVVLKNYHVQGVILIVLLHETVVTKFLFFFYGNELKVYEHLQFKKNFLGSLALAMHIREGKGWEGRGGERGKGKGEREGRETGELAPPNTKTKLRP
jgi:hypothetical protein